MSSNPAREETPLVAVPPPRRGTAVVRRAACALLLLIGGCGDSPTEKCDDMLSAICARVVECVGGLSQQTCEQELQAAVACGATTDVGAGYDRCMDQIRGFACSTLFPIDPATGDQLIALPANCQGVLESGGETSGQGATMDEAIDSVMRLEP